MLSNELVSDAKSVLRERAQTDSEPQVRAAALEALAGARQLDHGEAKRALQDKAPEVRAVAAAALASELKASDTPDLWKALNDPERGVRLAASTFLPHIQDASIGSKLWMLYLAESEQLDADPQFQRAVLDELGRAPFPELAHQVQERLQQPLSPIERRLLSRLFSKLNPVAAAQRFLAEMQAGEPQTRALAADVAPATPEVRARRFELLQDPDSDVRAAAIIGLCRAPDAPRGDERLGRVPLDPTPLGQEAVITRSQCGTPEPTPQPMQTSLEGSANMASGGANTGIWPALLGMVLMLASVFALRLKAKA
jgi:HEAT repeat protein